ncbi:uncharacterized protein LOC100892914 isoform X2 [Strongylocentrotus purpuratus]|uniref:SH3 domain-containing protein n=1 Tax=Strongylocentrotus purpuratus TaxID=7668 RepID=A0A7M7LTJ5_STRPU|nr:uncharacterized protein LOC100892914 isoform X2 [Strongylocentrotus purpuratus]|eukprot:XP_011676498.1 PREDICTED: uncharacterized protein LOC100892914 isoform X2 [Strongylocentrotus purpuratus]
MEVFEAKFDYVKQRKDVLSFKKGDKFYVIDKPNDEWWSARKVEDNAFGYVPSMYLEKSKEQFIGRLVPEGRRNTREHDIHLQALSELHQRVKPLPGLTLSQSCPAHVLGQALGVDVPKEPPPPAPQHITNQQRQKILISDFEVDEPEPISERLRSPAPPLTSPSSRSPRNSFEGGIHSSRGRSPSPQPFPRPKSKNGSFRHEDDSLPYHHKCNAAVEPKVEDDEDELPPHLRTTPPPPVSSPPPPDYDFDDDEDAPNGVPYHHKLNLSGRQETGRFIEVIDDHLDGPPNIPPTLIGRVDEDGLIQPKPLLNPVMESPMHKNLHRELRIRSQYPRRENTGSLEASGRSVLKQDELKKVFRDRSHKQSLKVMDAERNSRRTSLDVKLGERLKLTEEEESFKALETLEKAALQPEFMNLTLKSRSGSGKS